MPIFERIHKEEPESLPFHYPVDPDQLGLPDYFNVVKKPMDLSTIKKRLDDGHYVNPQEFTDDMWLMFNNAWLYNKKTSKVYKFCSKLAEIFTANIDDVMREMGYLLWSTIYICTTSTLLLWQSNVLHNTKRWRLLFVQ